MRNILLIILAGMSILFANTVACTNSLPEESRTLDSINEERNFHRAKEAALWSQPIMGVAMTLDAIKKLGGDFNDIAFLSRPSNWKWRILTPNLVSLYVTSVLKTSPHEPLVIEVPPATNNVDIFGTIMDSFQVPLADIGSQGTDAGKGGNYLILPPNYDGAVPAGYLPVPSERYISYIMFRVIPDSFNETDLVDANSFIRRISSYPLDNPGEKGRHIDAYDRTFDTVDPRDATYFDILSDILNQETVIERDLIMMGMMKTFGLIHGETFDLSASRRELLDKAVVSALDDLIVMTRDIAEPWWEGDPGWMQPVKPIGPMTQFRYVTETVFDTDPRGETFSMYCCAPLKLGAASAYIYATRDVDGEPLEARSEYVLHVPAGVPVQQFWSLTAYDAQTAVFFENVANTDISSLDEGLQYNDDGSVDLYVGPKAPKGKEKNWIETNSRNNSMFLFRFYGPQEGIQDGSWVMDGFKKAN